MYEGRQIKVEKDNQKMKTEINMKKNFNIISIKWEKLCNLQWTSDSIFCYRAIAIADTEPSEINTASEIQSNALNQTDSLPELKYAPENPKFTRYLNNKNYTQSAPSQSEYQTGFTHTCRSQSSKRCFSRTCICSGLLWSANLNRVTDERSGSWRNLLGICNLCLWIIFTAGWKQGFLRKQYENLLSSAYPEGFDYTRMKAEIISCQQPICLLSGPVDDDDPYDPSNYSSVYSPTGLRVQKHIRDVLIIPDRKSPMDNDNIKSAVQNYGAVYTTMYVDPAYYSLINVTITLTMIFHILIMLWLLLAGMIVW